MAAIYCKMVERLEFFGEIDLTSHSVLKDRNSNKNENKK